MKTKEEVAEWLKKQEWVEQFKNGIIKTLTGRWYAERIYNEMKAI